jgi:protease-4
LETYPETPSFQTGAGRPCVWLEGFPVAGLPKSFYNAEMKNTKPLSRRWLELCLNNTRPKPARLLPKKFGLNQEYETLALVQGAQKDKTINGILLNTSGFQASREYLWELRAALENCKSSGKKIAAYFDNADFDLYSLVSVADKVIMDAAGSLQFSGYAWGRFYVKDTLEKLGIGFRELRYMEYKSANEMFSHSSLSEADRVQYGAYLDEIFTLTKHAIMKGRSLTEEAFNSIMDGAFILSAAEAKARGLADAGGREEAIAEMIKELEAPEAPEREVTISYAVSGGSSLMTHGKRRARYAPPKPKGFGKAEIALINASGHTDLDEGMAALSLAKTIRETAERPVVKALVIRVNSPGGSAVAADYIAAALREVKKEKPVVVSMGSVAASGGYWASMYSCHIMASPYTLTGSIGVIAGWFFDKGLNGRLGVNIDFLARGEHADLFSGFAIPRRDMNEAEEGILKKHILDLYADFVKQAAECRGMTAEALEPLARGRVYSGQEAVRLGLADSIGGLLDALETAKSLAKIPGRRKIVIHEYPKPTFRESLMAWLFAAAPSGNALDSLGDAAGLLLPLKDWEDLRFRLSRSGRALAILPSNQRFAGF